jgi:hypothetical protein
MTLAIEQTGALSGLISLLLGKRTRQYVRMEAEGLKKAAEALRARGEGKTDSGEGSAS